MKLPTCSTCHYSFKWKELVFSIFGHKKCPICQQKQYITTESQWRLGVIGVFLPVIIFAANLLNLNWIWSGLIFVISFFLYLAIMPFLLQFSDKEQPLF